MDDKNMTGLKPQTLEELWIKLQEAVARISRLERENALLKKRLDLLES